MLCAAIDCASLIAAPAAHARDRHALQEIVQEHCVIDWTSRHDPAVLAHDLPDPRRTPGDYTLLLAGRQFKDGPGFVLFAGTELGAELLLDSNCAAAGSA